MFVEGLTAALQVEMEKYDRRINEIVDRLSNPPTDEWELENWRKESEELRKELQSLRETKMTLMSNFQRLISAVKSIEDVFLSEVSEYKDWLSDSSNAQYAWTVFNDIVSKQGINDVSVLEARAVELGKKWADEFKSKLGFKVREPANAPLPSSQPSVQTVPAAPTVATAWGSSVQTSPSSSDVLSNLPRTSDGEIDWEKVDVIPANEMREERARAMGEKFIKVFKERQHEAKYEPYRRDRKA